jgi:hypothetical protein
MMAADSRLQVSVLLAKGSAQAQPVPIQFSLNETTELVIPARTERARPVDLLQAEAIASSKE